jgi:quercetin dioxygenase-like cupin family protein
MAFTPSILAQHEQQGEAYWFLDGLSLVKVSSAQSGGAFSLIEDRLPAGRETPYHLHHRDDETFYIISGEATFMSGSQKIRGVAGSVIYLPRNIPHGFRAETAARLLILTTPGGFDEFVRDAGELAGSLTIPPPRAHDFQKLTTIAAKYGIDILGPLPG